MFGVYDVSECEGVEVAPQSTDRGLDSDPADDQANLAHCQKLLVRAKTQRKMYPLGRHVGDTKATDIAKAELRIAHAYRKVGSLDQVRNSTNQATPCFGLKKPFCVMHVDPFDIFIAAVDQSAVALALHLCRCRSKYIYLLGSQI